MAFQVLPVRAPVLGWLEERVGVSLTDRARGIAAVDAAGRIRGMVVYDGWTESAAQVHVATETPAAIRALLRPAFEYPFIEAGRLVLLASVREHNTAALRLDEHLGFRVVHRIPDGAAEGEAMLLLQLRREECRWLAPGRPERRRRGVSLVEPLGAGRA